MKIIKNFLEKELINYLYIYSKNLPHFYGNNSVHNTPSFYTTPLNLNDALNDFLCKKILNVLNNNSKILRMYLNIQHCFMDGTFHIDDGEYTILLMVSPTLQKNSGCFEIKENNEKLKIIPFIQNQLILFSSKLEHRGCAPIEKNLPRITLAFKTEKIKT